ncbi:MAG: hypothetical protein PQJ48_05825 [Sphaerochaetaceae bacterium]|nr:hypothetical protein [Sphaerochaetaceae bacterium]
MNKRITLAIVVLALLLVFGCDPSSNATTNAPASLLVIKGGWDFADQGEMTNIAVGIFPDESDATGNTGSADIDWHQGTLSFSCTGNGGSYSEGVLTGTYDKYSQDLVDTSITDTQTDFSIQITFSLDENNRLSFSCSGDGPLHGKSFLNGEKIP